MQHLGLAILKSGWLFEPVIQDTLQEPYQIAVVIIATTSSLPLVPYVKLFRNFFT